MNDHHDPERVSRYKEAIKGGLIRSLSLETAALGAMQAADDELYIQAKTRATHLEGELVRKHHEAKWLRQGLWDAWVALGHDSDGDDGPEPFIAGMGVDAFIRMVVSDAARFRKEAEDDYAADTDALRAEIEEYRAKNFAPMSRINRAERVAEQAVADKQAAEAERDALRETVAQVEAAAYALAGSGSSALIGAARQIYLALSGRSTAAQFSKEAEGDHAVDADAPQGEAAEAREEFHTRCLGCGATGLSGAVLINHFFHHPGAPWHLVREGRFVGEWRATE